MPGKCQFITSFLTFVLKFFQHSSSLSNPLIFPVLLCLLYLTLYLTPLSLSPLSAGDSDEQEQSVLSGHIRRLSTRL